MLIVSAIAAAVMFAGALILRGQDDDDGTEDLNVKAVLLDTAADAASAGGVAVRGAVILLTGASTGWTRLSPAPSPSSSATAPRA